MKINLISGPRNISTALMYSFAQRPDMEVVDEPFYAYYLEESGVDHPGRIETLESMSSDLQTLIDQWIDGPEKTEHLFIKNMAHHMIMDDFSFLSRVENLFLIRDPEKLITSFAKVIPEPKMTDIGLEHEWYLFNWLKEKTEKQPMVIDSSEILKDPERALNLVCEQLNIPFYSSMLSWEAGSRPEDGVWAPYWYKNVHKSTGFKRPTEQADDPFPEHCLALLEEAKPYYEKLLNHSIRI